MTSAQKWEDTTSARRASSRSGHRAPARERIIQAAAKAIEQHGVDADIGQVAAAAGVARPHVYRHFSGKDELLLEVARFATASLKARVRPSLTGSGTALDLIRAPIAETIAWAGENPGLYLFMTDRKQSSDRRRNRIAQDHLLDEIVAAMSVYVRAADLDASPLARVLAGLKGMVDASTVWWLEHRDEEIDVLVDRLSHQVWLVLRTMLIEVGVSEPDELVFDAQA